MGRYYLRYAPEAQSPPPPPPPLPLPGEMFLAFGHHRPVEETTVTLEARGIESVYSGPRDVRTELRRINHSLIMSVLETLDAITKRSSQYDAKVADIQLLVYNMLQLITEGRPQQAYDKLIEIMEVQNQDQSSVACDTRSKLNEVELLLNGTMNEIGQWYTLQQVLPMCTRKSCLENAWICWHSVCV